MRLSSKQPECLNCGKVPSLEAGHGGTPMCIREPGHDGQHSWEFALKLDDAGKAPWEVGYTPAGAGDSATVPGDSGPAAKGALLTQLGEHAILIDELVKMLVRKGVMTEKEWDDIQITRFVGDKKPVSTWACADKDDRAALDAFFGV